MRYLTINLGEKVTLVLTNGSRYSRMEQVKFVKDHITSFFLKTVFHKFYWVHS